MGCSACDSPRLGFNRGWNLIAEGPADLPAICGWPRPALNAAGLRRSSPHWVDASTLWGGLFEAQLRLGLLDLSGCSAVGWIFATSPSLYSVCKSLGL